MSHDHSSGRRGSEQSRAQASYAIRYCICEMVYLVQTFSNATGPLLTVAARFRPVDSLIDMFNALNHSSFSGISTSITNGKFGRFTATRGDSSLPCLHLCCSVLLLLAVLATIPASARTLPLKISDKHRFLETSDGAPFFWLGDTGWLLFEKLNRADTLKYLDDRHRKGFNVIQVMVIPSNDAGNFYGAAPLTRDADPHPAVTPGNRVDVPGEYDYWDHIDWVLDQAAERGMYLGMVACWHSVVDKGIINRDDAASYARFLAERFKNKTNVVWILGGDTRGDKNTEVWRTMGRT